MNRHGFMKRLQEHCLLNKFAMTLKALSISQKVKFVKAEVQAIDVAGKVVTTDVGTHTYDYLVIALGFEGETFGIPGLGQVCAING